jgi:hypothetical protein
MVVLTTSVSLILLVHFICPLKEIGLLPMSQLMMVQCDDPFFYIQNGIEQWHDN